MIDSPTYLKTLGIPELRRQDGAQLRLKVRKHLALLIYLAVDYRESHSRDSLVDLLWAAAPRERGRHSLSVALSVLRAVLGPEAIEASATHVRLIKGALVLDLDLLAQGQFVPDEGCPFLEIDRFLLDFEITDAQQFQHWRDRQQAELLPTIQAGVLALLDQARRKGDSQQMLMLAERLLELDPLAEEGIKAKMQALALGGDRLNALRVFQTWKADLCEHLGALPSDSLESLASRLRRPDLRRFPMAEERSANLAAGIARRFVGRAGECRLLSEAWDSATQLDSQYVLITGDTGIGKSTLAMHFGSLAALEGAAVARVQCSELEHRIAFGMIGALVASLLDRPGVVATAPGSLAEVARIVPQVRERYPHLPAPRRITGESARVLFAEGVFALIAAIMDEQPLLLIVDDFPRSDEASLVVLHMLLKRVRSEGLMVILAGRPPEPEESQQAQRLRAADTYLPIRHLTLRQLSDEESLAMLAGVLSSAPRAPARPICRAILVAASGNPMAIGLLAQDWASHGDLALAVSLPAMQVDMPPTAIEADAFDRLLERLIPALEPRTRLALYLAAILGQRLNDLDSFDIVHISHLQTMETLSDLVARRVLRDTGTRLEFTNDLLRARLYLRIPSAIRKRLHDRIARRLLCATAAGEQISGLEIAWHCIRAQKTEVATTYLISGAREAISHGAPDEAARALATALGHLKGDAREDAILLLAEAYQEMAEWKAALECLDELLEAEACGAHRSDMARLLAIESERELGRLCQGRLHEAAGQLIRMAQKSKHPELAVRAALAATSMGGGLRSDSLSQGIESVLTALSTQDLNPHDQGRLLLAKGVAQYHRRRSEKGRSEAAAGIRLLGDAGIADTTWVRVHIGLGAIACADGAYSDGIAPLDIAFGAALRLDNTSLLANVATNMTICHYRLGNAEQQLKWAKLGQQYGIASRQGTYDRIIAIANEGIALVTLGRLRDSELALGRLQEARKHAEDDWIRQAAVLYEADILWLTGARKAALARISTMLTQSREPLALGSVGKFVRWATMAQVREGRLDEAVSRVQYYYENLNLYDLLDQAEILASIRFVRETAGEIIADVSEEERAVFAKLPYPCQWQLRQLGLLLSN